MSAIRLRPATPSTAPRRAAAATGAAAGGRSAVAPAALILAVALAALAAVAAAPEPPPEAVPPAEPAGQTAEPPRAAGEVVVLDADSIVHTVLAEFLADEIAAADEAEAAAVVIRISTPGGFLDATRRIFRAMLGASTPVVVWVGPSGAQAASAGFFVLMAADVAAMAPGTNTGAAHPVAAGGEDIGETMGEKVEQDAAATIRSLAARRGRDLEAAEAAVVESRSYTADEAMEKGLIDLVTPSLAALLAEIDGREIEKGGRTVRLETRDAVVREVGMPPFKRVLTVLAHPTVAMLLLSLGALGIYFEFSNPGAILPGVLGAIFLVLAFFSLSILPVNYAGVALIVLAIVFFVAEVKVASFGLLTVAGVVSLVLGGLILVDDPDPAVAVSKSALAGIAVTGLALSAVVATLVVRSRRQRVRTGSEGLVEATGRAYTDFAPQHGAVRGKVFVQGEIWNAVADRPIPRDAPVRVLAVHGLTLEVAPAAGALVTE